MSEHYFIADAHLGASAGRSEEALISFLESINNRANSLYILGDLFDFWFEYRHTVPKYGLAVIAELARLRRRSVRVVYLAGNHDFRIGPWLLEQVEVMPGPELVETLDGLRVWMSHGEGLDRRPESVFFRKLSRSRTANWLYSLLHPDLGVSLASWVTGRSRERSPNEELQARMVQFAQAKVREGYDLIVLAHSHLPDLRRFDTGTYLNVGAWSGGLTYGVIRNGQVALERFTDKGYL